MFDGCDPARGKAIAALRGARLMTQASLAKASGLSLVTVKRAEAGKPLSSETAQALCSVFEVEPAGLRPADAPLAGAVMPAPPHAPVEAPDPAAPVRSPAGPPLVVRVVHVRQGMRWPSMVARACLAIAVLFQWLAWRVPSAPAMDMFRFHQAVSQTCIGLAFLMAAADMAYRSRRTAFRSAWCMATVACLAFAAFPTHQLQRGYDLWVANVARTFHATNRAGWLVGVRAALEPGWDAAEDRWVVRTRFWRAAGADGPSLRSPGTYAARERARKACDEAFLHAARWPAETCDSDIHAVVDRDPGMLWASLAGEAFWPDASDDPALRRILDGPEYARARAFYAAHETGEGEHRGIRNFTILMEDARAAGNGGVP